MTFFEILETLLIGPLKLVFEIIFQLAGEFIANPGLRIIILSLVMNLLVLPLYRRADAMQEASRDTEEKLRRGVEHIKKTFSGDERMMILQTYYRQNDYRPTDVLHGSVSLLLEIPFFMAAYQFLSHLPALNGCAFGPIADLGAPDGLIVLGGLTLNLLPVLMTAINIVSSALYLKGFPLKNKIQLYAMALFFLVFLYNSPSGLVFYWTLNNLFSLVKNVFYKLKNPRKVLSLLCSLAGLGLLAMGFVLGFDSAKKKLFFLGLALMMQLPLVLPPVLAKLPAGEKKSPAKPNKKAFAAAGLFMTVLVGLLIPSNTLVASPQEFVNAFYYYSPLWYVLRSLCYAAGVFLVWFRVFYWLAGEKAKLIFERAVWILAALMLANYLFFGNDLGIISPELVYVEGFVFSAKEQLMNLGLLLVLAVLVCFVTAKWKKTAVTVCMCAALAAALMSGVNIFRIDRGLESVREDAGKLEDPEFSLTKSGKNVVIFMLDRGMSRYVPYIFEEKPELKEQFSGFVYYSNTAAFGGGTVFGVPALFGGYEYTPVEMNSREGESMAKKHNEALLLMPELFYNEGYEVTVLDPSYVDFQEYSDLSLFDAYPGMDAYLSAGHFKDPEFEARKIYNNSRNFFIFSFMKTMPLSIQTVIYNNGKYHNSAEPVFENFWFMDNYDVLSNLHTITEIKENGPKTYLSITNNTTHEPVILGMPDYLPVSEPDNSLYEGSMRIKAGPDGSVLNLDTEEQLAHYHVNMAAMLQIGNWLDYLKDNGVYDNTRIIIVSDHGRNLGHDPALIVENSSDTPWDVEYYSSMLLVKDFDADGFETVDEFMTQADVPTIALGGLIENPVNPFTGKPINSDEKYAHEQFVTLSTFIGPGRQEAENFRASSWASVSGNIWDIDNWSFYEGDFVLKEHSAP